MMSSTIIPEVSGKPISPLASSLRWDSLPPLPSAELTAEEFLTALRLR